MLSTVYAALARRRREWYAARPKLRQRLRHPVISVGNIAVGGRGKTPFTATVARMLLEAGEIPAVLSRGYARKNPQADPVIVRDAEGIRGDLARSGDEPLMLARQLDGAIVIAGADRYASGRLAEEQLGATVHVLDDGFQHFKIDRDVDIVLVSGPDLREGRTLPTGRLREPPDVLIAADAVVCVDDEAVVQLPDIPVFRARRVNGIAVFDETGGAPPSAGAAIIAVAGIAHPESLFGSLRQAGWQVSDTLTFGDHHPYSAGDVQRIARAAEKAGARAILTTEKDYVRLLPHRPFPMPVGWVPHTMTPEPLEEFRRWLTVAVAASRDIVIG